MLGVSLGWEEDKEVGDRAQGQSERGVCLQPTSVGSLSSVFAFL